MGIQETKDVLIAANEVAVALIKAAKDGIQLTDGLALLANEEVKAALVKAADGISKLPEEMKDVDLNEGLELAAIQIQFIPKIVGALKA